MNTPREIVTDHVLGYAVVSLNTQTGQVTSIGRVWAKRSAAAEHKTWLQTHAVRPPEHPSQYVIAVISEEETA